MHLLCLVVGCSLACSDGPYGFVGEDDLAEFIGGEVEQTFFDLSFHDIKECSVLTLFEDFAYAEYRGEVVVKCETDFLAQCLGGLAVVLATL